MSAFQSLENGLNDLFVKNAPALPAGGKKALVQYLPWISLVAGILNLLAGLGLYHAARFVNAAANYVNTISSVYGGPKVVTSHFTVTVWLALALLVIEGIIYIAAFPATRDRKKSGWDLLFYALLINLAYGVVAAFTDYGGVGRLIGALLGSAIGGYLLFQIRASYLKTPASSDK